jgi:hypothetical protein
LTDPGLGVTVREDLVRSLATDQISTTVHA